MLLSQMSFAFLEKYSSLGREIVDLILDKGVDDNKTWGCKMHHLWETSAFNFFLKYLLLFYQTLILIYNFHPENF